MRACLFLILTLLPLCGQTPATPANLAAGGVSYNPGASPAVAGTGLYAHRIADSTYAFGVTDALPVSMRPFQVQTQFGAGVAQKLPFTIWKASIFVPTSAGISYTGTNTGWAWTTGGLASINWRGARIMPHVRLLKSSVSNGTGYQVIVGALFGWGW